MDVSVEVLQILERLLDVKMLMVLSMTCRPLLETLKALIEQRCKRECVMTYLYPTVASYRMQAAVPATWRQLYVAFNSLKDLCWQACRVEVTTGSVFYKQNLVDATIGEDQNVTEAEGHRQKLPFVQSSRQILMGKWKYGQRDKGRVQGEIIP
ncbi:unnamed protein product [Peronospora belbahrii]|uniref:F-box domain-containing protein n=1 Tax=Peronospora belbahrii TaxID=622444 RepID=A0AAU9LER8_9STRA|nr:unnamed protein product [Peronospora belbahrii]